MKILRLGHAMYVLTSKSGRRYLIDPFFEMNPGCPAKYQTEEFLQTIDAVLLTHGHFDHTSGLAQLKKANPDCLVIAQYELALILMQNGFEQIYPLNLGGSFSFEDVEISMVPAKHTSSYKETEGTPIYAGEAAGYILAFCGDHVVYHSGDTALMLDMKLIQEVYQPTIAILSTSGQFTMGPKEAKYAIEHLLNVQHVIPSHTFPSMEEAHSKETLQGLLQAFPVVANMMGQDQELKTIMQHQTKTTITTLGFGEEISF